MRQHVAWWAALVLAAGLVAGCGGGGSSSPGGDGAPVGSDNGGGTGGSDDSGGDDETGGGDSGGDGDTGGTTPPPTAAGAAEGLWRGTTDTGRQFVGLVFENGTHYFFYSTVADPDTWVGVVQGQGALQDTAFTSTDALDFQFEVEPGAIVDVDLSATPGSTSLIGNVVPGGGGAYTFSLADDADYANPPSLAALAGQYSGTVMTLLGGETATVTIGSDGVISGEGASDCRVEGQASVHADGNAYHFTLGFEGSACDYTNAETFAGIAYLDTASGQLMAAAPNAARDAGVLFVGERQP